jgi:hypothetical protein
MLKRFPWRSWAKLATSSTQRPGRTVPYWNCHAHKHCLASENTNCRNCGRCALCLVSRVAAQRASCFVLVAPFCVCTQTHTHISHTRARMSCTHTHILHIYSHTHLPTTLPNVSCMLVNNCRQPCSCEVLADNG